MIKKLYEIDINRIIIHEVAKQGEQLSSDFIDGVRLSKNVITLNSTLKEFYKKKITQSLGSKKVFKIKFNEEIDNPSSFKTVKLSTENYFSDISNDTLLIEESIEISKRLYNIQNLRNPAGILVFLPGKINEKDVLIMLKVEREEGLELIEEKSTQGFSGFGMQLLDNIMLTDKGALFKATMFYQDKSSIKGYMSDAQTSMRSKNFIANFYLEKFLGAKFEEDPSVTTKLFYDLSYEFLKNELDEDKDKIAFSEAIYAELNNTLGTVDTTDFATRTFHDQRLKESYKSFLNRNNCGGFIVKDTGLIDTFLRKTRIRTEKGITISGPQDVISNEISMSPNLGGTQFNFIDKVKDID